MTDARRAKPSGEDLKIFSQRQLDSWSKSEHPIAVFQPRVRAMIILLQTEFPFGLLSEEGLAGEEEHTVDDLMTYMQRRREEESRSRLGAS